MDRGQGAQSDAGVKSLARRTVVGSTIFFVMLAVLLFGPAGSLDYWQAWVYLCVVAILSTLITAYLWKKDPRLLDRRVYAGPTAEKERSQKWAQVFAYLTFLGTMIVSSLDHRFSWSSTSQSSVIAGDVLAALGLLVVFRVFKENTFAAATIEVVEGQKVISTGPYSIVRHPMYSGALVMLLGTPLALGSYWGLLMLIPMTVVFGYRAVEEEKFLSRNLPGYAQYLHRVRHRLVPFVW